MAQHLHIDPFSGIAGDMFLAALVDLGASLDDVRAAIKSLKLPDAVELHLSRVTRCGVSANHLHVHADHHHHGHGGAHRHPHHRHYPDLIQLAQALDAPDRARRRAVAVIDALADAEARVHGIARAKVHFHEVGALDSIVDMLGAAVALEGLDVETVSCGPLPLSRGWVRCDHGRMPVPPPATAYLMEGLPVTGVEREGELVTPTGAALVVGLRPQFGPPPAMTVNRVGYGAGTRDDPEYPNVLRLFLGQARPVSSFPAATSREKHPCASASSSPS